MSNKLTLHVGLAKSGTTFYQREVFPHVRGYLGKHYSEALPQQIFSSFERLHFDYLRGKTAPLDFDRWVVRNLSSESHVFMSSEALALWRIPDRANASFSGTPDNFSNRSPSSSHPLVGFLRQLQTSIEGQIRIVLSLRNQTDLLASHLAHGGLPNGAELVQVARNRDCLLDYFSLVYSIRSLVGAKNLLVLLFEDGFAKNTANIADFLVASDDFPTGTSIAQRFHNSRRIDSDNWQVRRQPKLFTSSWFLTLRSGLARRPILFSVARGIYARVVSRVGSQTSGVASISSHDRAEVRRFCRASNVRLARLLQRDLDELGY